VNSNVLFCYPNNRRLAKHLLDTTNRLGAYQNRCEERATIILIQLKINESCRWSQKELSLRPHLIFTTSIELISILTPMLDIQCALRTRDHICFPPSSLSRSSRRVRSWGLVSIRSVPQATVSHQMPAFRKHIDLDSDHPLLSSDLSE